MIVIVGWRHGSKRVVTLAAYVVKSRTKALEINHINMICFIIIYVS